MVGIASGLHGQSHNLPVFLWLSKFTLIAHSKKLALMAVHEGPLSDEGTEGKVAIQHKIGKSVTLTACYIPPVQAQGSTWKIAEVYPQL